MVEPSHRVQIIADHGWRQAIPVIPTYPDYTYIYIYTIYLLIYVLIIL